MDALAELTLLEAADGFVARHIGPSDAEIAAMLHEVGAATLDDLAAKTVPPTILSNRALDLPPPIDEAGVLAELRGLAADNVVKKSLIGMGYHGTHTPPGAPHGQSANNGKPAPKAKPAKPHGQPPAEKKHEPETAAK